MKKISKSKNSKKISIEDIEAMSLRGEDTSSHFGSPKRMPPRELRKIPNSDIKKVNVDLTASFLKELDEIALFLNVSRQAVMKGLLKEGVDRHFLAQRARKTG